MRVCLREGERVVPQTGFMQKTGQQKRLMRKNGIDALVIAGGVGCHS